MVFKVEFNKWKKEKIFYWPNYKQLRPNRDKHTALLKVWSK